jgi:hypothetical protein
MNLAKCPLKVDVRPAPKFNKPLTLRSGISEGIATSNQWMHDEWWYVIDGTWCAESTITLAN